MRKLIFTALLLLTVVCGLWTITYAEIPRLINYQGRLTDKDGKPINGSYKVTFRIFDAAEGGSQLWEEIHSAIVVEKGIFSALLGSVNNLNLAFDKPYFLEIKVEDDEPLKPKQQIASAGYAIRADKAENANNATNATNAANANTVAGVGVSTTPAANKLLPLDNNAKLPLASLGLKVYDSGWFPVSLNSTYTKTHELGTSKIFLQVWYSASSNGNDAEWVFMNFNSGHGESAGCWANTLTTTSIKLNTGTHDLTSRGYNGMTYGGVYTLAATSGYYRVVALALE